MGSKNKFVSVWLRNQLIKDCCIDVMDWEQKWMSIFARINFHSHYLSCLGSVETGAEMRPNNWSNFPFHQETEIRDKLAEEEYNLPYESSSASNPASWSLEYSELAVFI